ncbi:MAG: HU family DNA-binding protein [Candidatus Eremiobacteraeota bacterium]|nr:HU family DNA-binding protein [Candidatus Eremiobacteraeota bacterium]
MNKRELVNSIVKKSTLTKSQVRQVVDETFQHITETLARGEKFQLVGFGSFIVKRRSARRGTNPQTGEKILIEAKNAPVFSAGKKLMDAVNKDN